MKRTFLYLFIVVLLFTFWNCSETTTEPHETNDSDSLEKVTPVDPPVGIGAWQAITQGYYFQENQTHSFTFNTGINDGYIYYALDLTFWQNWRHAPAINITVYLKDRYGNIIDTEVVYLPPFDLDPHTITIGGDSNSEMDWRHTVEVVVGNTTDSQALLGDILISRFEE